MAAHAVGPRDTRLAAVVIALISVVVVGFGWLQVRRGAWNHIDASHPTERRLHNRLSLVVLAAGTAAVALGGMLTLAAGIATGTLIVAVAMALSPWLKLSQHVAFAALASVLAFTIAPEAGVVALFFLALLAWSRLELGRHTPAEIGAGTLVGFIGSLVLLTAVHQLLT